MTNPDMTSPVDLPPPDGEEQHPLLWASIVIAVATGFLLLFNSSALRSWAFELEPSQQNERVVAIADGWFQKTEAFYLDRPVAAMSGWWDAVKALEFGSDDQASNAADDADADVESETEDAVVEESDASPAAEVSDGPGFSLQ